jgi:hypothetical protein
MVEEHDLEYWCDMMVKTYNTSILDNFPTSLKRSLQEEATQCVESKPNPNYHRSFLRLKTKKNRNVLMRLINNYVRSKQIESPTIDFIGGPHTLTLHWSAKYNKIIYIFGEVHRNDVCDYDNMMLVENYLKNLFRRSGAFIDFFLEIPMFVKGKYDDGFEYASRLNILINKNKECIETTQRQKNRHCDTKRIHFIDIRQGPLSDKDFEFFKLNSTVYFQKKIHNFIKINILSKDEIEIFYHGDKEAEKNFKIVKEKLGVIHFLTFSIFKEDDINLKPTIDFIVSGTEETYEEFCKEQMETHEFIRDELSKSTEASKIREFAKEEFEKERHQFIKKIYSIRAYLKKCYDKTSKTYNFYKLSEYEYIRFFIRLSKFFDTLVNLNSILVDIYTLARMFKKFQLNYSRNTRKTDEPEEPHNIIMYAGDEHSERVRRFLKKLEFDLISESKGDWKVDFCVDIRDFEQPFFSSWPPNKMPLTQTKSRSEEILYVPLEPTSEEMLASDFQIQTRSMNEIDEYTELEVLKYEAILIYKGNDQDFINRTGIQIDMVLSKIDITFYPDQIGTYTYIYLYDYAYKTKTYNVYYKGLVQISNCIHSEDLIRRFPFLENLKYVDYVMLFLSVQKALESKFITSRSNIIIDITRSSTIKNHSECIRKLVKFYEKIGFRKMFPTHYEDVMERIDNDLHDYIPMIGNVENITESWSNFENPSVLLELIK